MAEKMPDRIWAGLFDTPIEGMQIRVWSEKQSEPELTSEYLRSTPARKHADEMRELLIRMRADFTDDYWLGDYDRLFSEIEEQEEL